MSRASFNKLIGLKFSRVALLFADVNDPGWMDTIAHDSYPELDAFLTGSSPPIIGKDIIVLETLKSTEFALPRCLDDFGFIDWINQGYDSQYTEMVDQWCRDRKEIVREQSEIYEQSWQKLPVRQGSNLYFIVSEASGKERVIYIGKQQSKTTGGMRRRLVDHIKYNPDEKTNNYIGDCLNKSNVGRQYLSIRVKSAEMRRRGFCRVYWTDLSKELIKRLASADYGLLQNSIESIETYYIRRKLSLIQSTVGVSLEQDPVNR